MLTFENLFGEFLATKLKKKILQAQSKSSLSFCAVYASLLCNLAIKRNLNVIMTFWK